ncbi:MAG: IPT/TIG domain-containing protein [Candidatus Acidiferrales bacterium]
MTLAINGLPRIDRVTPPAAIPGGEIVIHGHGFAAATAVRPRVRFGENEGELLFHADSYVIARVPEGGGDGTVRVAAPSGVSQPFAISVGVQIADNLHPVGNPAVDAEGNIYVTFSGQRGERVPVSLYKITSNYTIKPFTTQLVNPSGLAVGRDGLLYVSCRHDGTIHRVAPDGRAEQWAEGMGIATGIVFDRDGNLYVGDRSGTIFKIGRNKEIFVFATLEPSLSFYHLAFSPAGELFVAGPTTSSFDRVYRITQGGEVTTFFRGLGRPQGLAFDRKGNLYVAASIAGRRGIVRISDDGKAELVLGGQGIVGMALLPTRRAFVVTTGALFSLDWDVEGLPLPI